MAAPTHGNWATGINIAAQSITDANVGSPQYGDIVFIMVQSDNEAISLSTPAGFTEIPTQIGVGTTGGTGSTRMAIYWQRITSTPMATVTVADAGDHIVVGAGVVSGASLDGTPFDIQWTSNATGSTSVSFPSVSGVMDDSAIILWATNGLDPAVQTFSFASISNPIAGSITPATATSPSASGYSWQSSTNQGGEVLCAFKAFPNGNTSTGTSSATQGSGTGNTSVSATMVVRSRNVDPYPYLRGVSSQISDSVNSGTMTCNYPSESVNGDLLVMAVTYRRSTGTTAASINTPSGWTLLNTEDHSTTSLVAQVTATYWRFRGAETSVTATYTQTTSVYGYIQIHAYDAATVDSTNPVSTSAISYDSNSSSSSARNCPAVTTPSAYNSISLFASMIKTSTLGTEDAVWGSSQERTDLFSGPTADMLAGSSIALKATAGSTGTYPVTPGGTTAQSQLATVAVQPLQTVPKSSTDTLAAATDSAQVNVALGDTSTGTDPRPAITASQPIADAGSGGDPKPTVTVAASESSGAVDSAVVIVQASEAAGGAETAGGLHNPAVADAGAFTETAQSSSAIQVSDGGTATDSVVGVTVRSVESGAGGDVVIPMVVGLNGSDTSTAADSASVLFIGTPDTGTGTDSATVTVRPTDSGSGADSSNLSVVQFTTDTATGNDSAMVIVQSSDGSLGTDGAFVLIEGVGVIGERVVRVKAEPRGISPRRDPHVYQIKPENRLRIFGRDNRTVKIAPSFRDPERVYSVDKETD